ncbi:MAG: hypothetical protein CMA12_02560 [Euryarchaeota archaeon]|nr:hypothetical protein [Euryarchaeota archaeon]OUW22734.1 MAG: hypothetical protein CBD33_01130 [Euryarchaeota archaeon TMED173]
MDVSGLLRSWGVLAPEEGHLMVVPELRWEPSIFEDPLGGKIILWPYLPCVRMPSKMRPREWNGLALISSSDEILSLREEELQEIESPGVHVDSAAVSGTTLGMLVRSLSELDIEGPSIPDPEKIRLLRHAENSRGGMPIYAIEPAIDDEHWAEWQSRWADEQVRFRNLLATIGRNRRWSKAMKDSIPNVTESKWANSDLGAAATVCYSWWREESLCLTEELIREREQRISSRLRGALADMRKSDFEPKINEGPVLLVPVHQPRMPSLENTLIDCEHVEELGREQ